MKFNNLSKISSNILLSRITGLLRDMLFANFLGASILSDAFMFAFRLPNLLRRILAEGAINSVFIPLYLDKKTPTLKVIQNMRNEAHRFGITHHRNRRMKGLVKTELTSIEGIGDKTITILLTKYKSVKMIKTIPLKELESLIGNDKAVKVFKALKK